MYQRYFSEGRPDWPQEPRDGEHDSPQEEGFQEVSAAQDPQKSQQNSPLSGLKGLFGGKIQLPEINADTILLLVLVYFLVADEGESVSDTLLIIGVLLLLGF